MRSNHLAKQQKNAAARRSIDRSGVIEVKANEKNQDSSFLTAYTQFSQLEGSVEGSPDPLAGLGHQGGLVQISTGGGLKTQINTSTTFTPLTIMSIEIHVQCRVSIKDQKQIAMVPDSSRDAVFAVVYVYCRDPGGGESLENVEKGCVLVMIEAKGHSSSTIPINATLGASLDASVEIVKTEANLLLRIASIVKQADPDVLVSWDTQGEGIGYLVERGVAISTPSSTRIDMARLLGRTPRLIVPDVVANDTTNFNTFGGIEGLQQRTEDGHSWIGSGLGAEWDDRVGSGAAASSIVSQHFIL
jgi:DNA polymerase elongation subunit (family B)